MAFSYDEIWEHNENEQTQLQATICMALTNMFLNKARHTQKCILFYCICVTFTNRQNKSSLSESRILVNFGGRGRAVTRRKYKVILGAGSALFLDLGASYRSVFNLWTFFKCVHFSRRILNFNKYTFKKYINTQTHLQRVMDIFKLENAARVENPGFRSGGLESEAASWED